MTDIIIPILYLLSGVCAHAGYTRAAAGLQRLRDPVQILFAILCVLIGLSTAGVLLISINLALPLSLQYSDIVGLRTLHLPWGSSCSSWSIA